MTTEQALEFAQTIPFEELFEEIRRVTGLQDLVFTKEFRTNYRGDVIPEYSSQDITDKVGFLNLLFKTIKITQFSSQISYDDRTASPYYWGTVDFSYTHHSGGSNGHTFMTVWYEPAKNGWTFWLDREERR